MEYIIENELLKVTVTTAGGELVSIIRKDDGVEHMWSADPAVWSGRAPILFPYCGRVPGNVLQIKGKEYPAASHGIARLMEFELTSQSETQVSLVLRSGEKTLERFPFRFSLTSTFTLDGDTLHHTLTVENLDEEEMPFGIGYHPGFAIPFDANHKATDYELRFDCPESPLCLSTPKGFVTSQIYPLGKNITAIPVDEHLFDNDSHCMVGLHSKTLGLYEKDSNRAVVCSISGFPYVLIWSMPGTPHFVCIEPWMSRPSSENDTPDYNEKAAAAVLQPGENMSVTMSTAFVR